MLGLTIGCDGWFAPRHDVILISIDTLRPDHLGCYGYPRPTSPAIDAFCDDAVVFEQAIAHAPSTLPSHASIFTSALPHHHGAAASSRRALSPDAITLAEELSDAGYMTAAFTGGGQLDAAFGIAQGFDEYHEVAPLDFGRTVEIGLQMLLERDEAPLFVFLHTYEVHHPYRPKPEHLAHFESDYAGELPRDIEVELLEQINAGERAIDDADLAHIVATYDAGVRSMDAAFEQLIAGLKAAGLYEDALIVFTSDHGEEFLERSHVGWHSHTLYDELLKVPLIMKLPGRELAGTRVSELVRGIDIAPSILGALERRGPNVWDGVDLLARLRAPSDQGLFAISALDGDSIDHTSIRSSEWKLIERALFDLAQDPGETQAVSDAQRAAKLKRKLKQTVSARQAYRGEVVELDDATVEALEALGYVVPGEP
jgi:arylsulfatase A-like enzyme